MMWAMPLEYPEDPDSWDDLCEHQYCFGAELLVAPLYYGFSRTRLDPSPDTLVPASMEAVRQAGDGLRIDVYPGADGRFCLVDGTEYSWDDAAQTLTISNSPVGRQVSARRVGVNPGRFTSAESAEGTMPAGRTMPIEPGSLNGEAEYARVVVDGQGATLRW